MAADVVNPALFGFEKCFTCAAPLIETAISAAISITEAKPHPSISCKQPVQQLNASSLRFPELGKKKIGKRVTNC